MNYLNKSQPRWSLGAKALADTLMKEFLKELQRATEEFVIQEKRQTVEEEDLKISLIDLQKKLAEQSIQLPSGKFTQKELLHSIRILKDRMDRRNKESV